MKNLKEIFKALLDGKVVNNKANSLFVMLSDDGNPRDQNGKTAYFLAPEQWEVAPTKTEEPKKLYAFEHRTTGEVKHFTRDNLFLEGTFYRRVEEYDQYKGEE